jgi:hypothetical protein
MTSNFKKSLERKKKLEIEIPKRVAYIISGYPYERKSETERNIYIEITDWIAS